MVMYDDSNIVRGSFDLSYISEYLLQAQWAELIELKKIIKQVSRKKKMPVSILDIGIGNARIVKHLCGIKDIWQLIEQYDGTDNAQACVDLSLQVIQELSLADKVSVHLFDANNLDTWQKQYDLIICTWFTPGNFYPDGFSFEKYNPQQNRLDLSFNPAFERVFSAAYKRLKVEGEIVLGACYLDNNATRLKQEESYKKMGMTIITDEFDSFTATKQGFWSQRFTKEKLHRYLPFTSPENITITPLDTYDYAIQVRVQ